MRFRWILLTVFSGYCLFWMTCCALGAFWLDGYYLTYKTCRPIGYPSGEVAGQGEGKRFAYTTADRSDAVIAFYDQRLKPYVGSYYADLGEWSKSKLPGGNYRYACASVDINRLTTETGCIYVRPGVDGTYIEGWLIRGEGGEAQCPG